MSFATLQPLEPHKDRTGTPNRGAARSVFVQNLKRIQCAA